MLYRFASTCSRVLMVSTVSLLLGAAWEMIALLRDSIDEVMLLRLGAVSRKCEDANCTLSHSRMPPILLRGTYKMIVFPCFDVYMVREKYRLSIWFFLRICMI